MSNKLTKNFAFFESADFRSEWKEKIVSSLITAEKIGVNKSELEKSILEICSCLEYVLCVYVCLYFDVGNKEVFNKTTKLVDKINLLEEKMKSNSFYEIKEHLHSIRIKRNKISHISKDLTFLDDVHANQVINLLYHLYVIVINLFKKEQWVPKKFDFDYKLYAYGQNLHNNISGSANDNCQEPFPELQIYQNSILDWLTKSKTVLKIPIYQRNYEWEEDNINVLLDDIAERGKDNSLHYFGTIAQKTKTCKDGKEIKIIDGQQRLTTSILLLFAAKNLLCDKYGFLLENWNQTFKLVLSKNINQYICNPSGTEDGNRTFKELMEIKPKFSQEMKQTRLFKNYMHLYNYFNNKNVDNFSSPEDICNFVYTFLIKFQVASIDFDGQKYSNKKEMTIFENLNSKGVELSINDLIKNHIFNMCSDQLLNGCEDLIPIKFRAMLSNVELDNDTDGLGEFYLSLAEIFKGREIPKQRNERFNDIKNTINELLDYKDKELDTIEKYKNKLDILSKKMTIFQSITKKRDFYNGSFDKLFETQKIMDMILIKNKKIYFIYFAYLIIDVVERTKKCDLFVSNLSKIGFLSNSEKNSVKKLFLEICKYIIRTSIITRQGESEIKRIMITIVNDLYKNIKSFTELSKFCDEAIIQIKKIYKENIKYSIENLKNSLKNNTKSSQAILSTLLLVESFMKDSIFGGGEIIDRGTKSIEHIMPRTPSLWIEELSTKEQQDNFAINHQEYLDKIGNYLILTQQKNSQAKNAPFLDKKSKTYSNLGSPLYVNEKYKNIDISSKNEWNFDLINKRTNELISYIIDVVFQEK